MVKIKASHIVSFLKAMEQKFGLRQLGDAQLLQEAVKEFGENNVVKSPFPPPNTLGSLFGCKWHPISCTESTRDSIWFRLD